MVFKESNGPDMFKSFYRMEKSTFEELVRLVQPSINKKRHFETLFRRTIKYNSPIGQINKYNFIL